MKFQKILLTTDLSEEAERPYATIAELAGGSGAQVRLLHVVEEVVVAPHGAPLAPPVRPPDLEKEMAQAREILANHLGKLGAGVEVDSDVIAATNVAEAVADYASEHGYDLIALSTHGRSGFRRLVMGSVAEQVLRHAHTPVLAFPRNE